MRSEYVSTMAIVKKGFQNFIRNGSNQYYRFYTNLFYRRQKNNLFCHQFYRSLQFSFFHQRNPTLRSFSSIAVNNRNYLFPHPSTPIVAILLDGSCQEYFDAASMANKMPNYNRILGRNIKSNQQLTKDENSSSSRSPKTPIKFKDYYTTTSIFSPASPTVNLDHLTNSPFPSGSWGLVSAVMPTYTNPNNVAIICGATPAVTGISGNYYYDEEAKENVTMNTPTLLRCPTIFAELNKKGVKVTIVTVKDKLSQLLSAGLNKESSFAISVENINRLLKTSRNNSADGSTKPNTDSSLQSIETNYNINLTSNSLPDIYDPMCSIKAIELGIKFIEKDMKNSQKNGKVPRIYYFSTTDYLQHTYPPHHDTSILFYSELDKLIGKMNDMGCIVGITADHGMNNKMTNKNKVNVIYLADFMNKNHPDVKYNIVLPITDAHVIHHGGLGGYACIYIQREHYTDTEYESKLIDIMKKLRELNGIYTVLSKSEAAKNLELPPDRIGDIIVIGDIDTVLGDTAELHRDSINRIESAGLNLRSHGSFSEMLVPLFINRLLKKEKSQELSRGKLRNFDMMDLLLNWTEEKERK